MISPQQWESICSQAQNPGPNMQESLKSIESFAERQDCLECTVSIILSETPVSDNACFYLLGQVHKFIKKYWNPELEICQQFKNAFCEFMYKNLGRMVPNLTKMAEIVVTIATFEWPEIWPEFGGILTDGSEEHITQTLRIISILSTAINEFDEKISLTGHRLNIMNKAFLDLSEPILQILVAAFSMSPGDNLELYSSALEALNSICSRIDCQFIFNSDILIQILEKCNGTELIRNALKVIAEVISVGQIDEERNELLVQIFSLISQVLAENDFSNEMQENSQWLEGLLCITIPNMFEQYSDILEIPDYQEQLDPVITSILKLTDYVATEVSNGDDTMQEPFEKCIDFWYKTTQRIVTDMRSSVQTVYRVYCNYLPELIRILIVNIVNPIPVNQTEDNELEVESKIKYGDLYYMMKNTIGYLTKIDTRQIIITFNSIKVELEQNFDINLYQKLCWAGGGVLQMLNEQSDKNFVKELYGTLAGYFEQVEENLTNEELGNLENEEMVNIIKMCNAYAFICSQGDKFYVYDKELLEHVVQHLVKMFEARSPVLQLVAIESFSILSNSKIKYYFTEKSEGNQPIAEHLIQLCQNIVTAIPPQSAVTLISTVCQMARNLTSQEVNYKAQILDIVVQLLRTAIDQFNTDEEAPVRNLISACQICGATSTLGQEFYAYFCEAAGALYNLFQGTTNTIFEIIKASQNVEQELLSLRCKLLQNVQTATVTLLSKIFCLTPPEVAEADVMQKLVEMMEYFQETDPIVKNATFFEVVGNVAKAYPQFFVNIFENFFSLMFQPTMMLINPQQNYQDFLTNFPLRRPFFKMLQSIIIYIPDLFTHILPERTIDIINAVIFGCYHPTHEVSEVAHDILRDIIVNARDKCGEKFRIEFFNGMLLNLFSDAIKLATDTAHMFCFHKQALLVNEIMQVPEAKAATDNLFNLLCSLFQTIDPADLAAIFQSLAELKANDGLTDLLCLTKHVSRFDKQILAEKRQAALEALRQRADEAAKQIETQDFD